MTQVSEMYLKGIKEGRQLFNSWKRDGIVTRDLLEMEIEATKRLRNRAATCAYSERSGDFFNGQIDFWRNQLKSVPT